MLVEDVVDTFSRFNECVDRIAKSTLAARFSSGIPHATFKFFDDTRIINLGDGKLSIFGRMKSWTEDYNDDEVNSAILTYRLFIQNSDGISIEKLSEIYATDGMPEEARMYFNHARGQLNDFLKSPTAIGFSNKYLPVKLLMEVIIYGGLAHMNKDKRKILQSWMQPENAGLFQVEFLASLKIIFDYLYYIRDLNTEILNAIPEQT